MISRLAIFVGASAAFWVLVGLPARHYWGDDAALASALALAVCLVPGALTLAWSLASLASPPEQQLVAVLGGTGARLAVVAVAALLLNERVAPDQGLGFLSWLLIFYCFTLALEMALVLRARPGTGRPLDDAHNPARG